MKEFPLLPRIWSADTLVMWAAANQWHRRGFCVFRCYNHKQGQDDKKTDTHRHQATGLGKQTHGGQTGRVMVLTADRAEAAYYPS